MSMHCTKVKQSWIEHTESDNFLDLLLIAIDLSYRLSCMGFFMMSI